MPMGTRAHRAVRHGRAIEFPRLQRSGRSRADAVFSRGARSRNPCARAGRRLACWIRSLGRVAARDAFSEMARGAAGDFTFSQFRAQVVPLGGPQPAPLAGFASGVPHPACANCPSCCWKTRTASLKIIPSFLDAASYNRRRAAQALRVHLRFSA